MKIKERYIKVDWLDAASSQDFYKPGKIGILHRSIGHQIKNDKEGIVLGMTQVIGDGTGDMRHYLEIPRAYVKKVTRLV
jgi:hypothetical protein